MKTKPNKQPEQEESQRNGHHMEGYQWGREGGEMRKKVQGIRSINGRYKTDRGSFRIV